MLGLAVELATTAKLSACTSAQHDVPTLTPPSKLAGPFNMVSKFSQFYICVALRESPVCISACLGRPLE
jgi:hypothetical protein